MVQFVPDRDQGLVDERGDIVTVFPQPTHTIVNCRAINFKR